MCRLFVRDAREGGRFLRSSGGHEKRSILKIQISMRNFEVQHIIINYVDSETMKTAVVEDSKLLY